MFENLGRTQKNLAKEIEEVYFAGIPRRAREE